MKLSDSMKRAILWLDERGGSGVIDCYGRLVAGGEVAKHIDPSTWLRLVAAACITGASHRLRLVSNHAYLIIARAEADERVSGAVRVPGRAALESEDKPND